MAAEVQLVYRTNVLPSQRPSITHTHDAYELLLRHWDRDKILLFEEFKVLYLNRSNRVLAMINLSSGGLSGTVADPRIILVTCLKLNATAMIISHNHPGGSLRPSAADTSITHTIKQAATLLDICLMDHIILTVDGYFSFAEEGLI